VLTACQEGDGYIDDKMERRHAYGYCLGRHGCFLGGDAWRCDGFLDRKLRPASRVMPELAVALFSTARFVNVGGQNSER
jgi:hypothetical protein